MKKFYKSVVAGTAPGGHVVRLDGKVLKTPLGHNLVLPFAMLAEKIAAEWERQGPEIKPDTMPLTQLTNVMLDKAMGADRAVLNEEVLRFSGSDLICYFGTYPADLVARQEENWRPLLQWMQERYDIILEAVSGIRYHTQPESALGGIKAVVTGLSPAAFTVVQAATGMTGSIVIALAMLEGRLDAEGAFQAAAVDEIYQLEKWGEDALARKRLDYLRRELESVALFRALTASL